MTMRLSIITLAGMARTLVAVGTSSEADMFLTTAAAAPRSTCVSSPPARRPRASGRACRRSWRRTWRDFVSVLAGALASALAEDVVSALAGALASDFASGFASLAASLERAFCFFSASAVSDFAGRAPLAVAPAGAGAGPGSGGAVGLPFPPADCR